MSSQSHPSKSTTQDKQKQQPIRKLDAAPSEDSDADDEYLYTMKNTKDAPKVSTPVVKRKSTMLLKSSLSEVDYVVFHFDETYNDVLKKSQTDLHVSYWSTATNAVTTRY